MCLAIPGKVVELTAETPHLALIEVAGVRRQVNVDLVREEGLATGDWVLIHVGFAMSKISEDNAQEQMRMLSMLGEDLEAMREIEGYDLDVEEGAPSESEGEASRAYREHREQREKAVAAVAGRETPGGSSVS